MRRSDATVEDPADAYDQFESFLLDPYQGPGVVP